METIIRVNSAINEFAWGLFGLTLLLATGVVCTLSTGVFQIRRFRHWWSRTFAIINGEGLVIDDAGALSQVRAFFTSLCATIGTGNIAGVSTAICAGGPGAVLWMWVAAFLGMMVKYAENVLGMYYRRRNSEGAWSGGAMYYLQDGLGSLPKCGIIGRIMGVLFCIFTTLASFGIGNMSQINKITINVESTFLPSVGHSLFLGAPKIDWLIGFMLMALVAIITLGGFRRLAAVSEKLVPFMTIAYIIGCMLMILLHITKMPAVIASIFRFALGPEAIRGGAMGTTVQLAINTIKNGCKRGVFSNEAGMGSSVMVHSNSSLREPVRQGMWGIAEVFLDTMVVCTMTALVVLSSGAIDLETGLVREGVDDATLVAKAFGSSLGMVGEWFVVLVIILFAFTTVMGWSYYGVKAVEYLLGVTCSRIYRVIFILLIVFGAVMESNLAWDISDTFNGLMMLPNLIGIITLTPLLVRLTRNYIDRRIRGLDIEPMLSYDPDIQQDAANAVKAGRT